MRYRCLSFDATIYTLRLPTVWSPLPRYVCSPLLPVRSPRSRTLLVTRVAYTVAVVPRFGYGSHATVHTVPVLHQFRCRTDLHYFTAFAPFTQFTGCGLYIHTHVGWVLVGCYCTTAPALAPHRCCYDRVAVDRTHSHVYYTGVDFTSAHLRGYVTCLRRSAVLPSRLRSALPFVAPPLHAPTATFLRYTIPRLPLPHHHTLHTCTVYRTHRTTLPDHAATPAYTTWLVYLHHARGLLVVATPLYVLLVPGWRFHRYRSRSGSDNCTRFYSFTFGWLHGSRCY